VGVHYPLGLQSFSQMPAYEPVCSHHDDQWLYRYTVLPSLETSLEHK
jgi:hypothetical protein